MGRAKKKKKKDVMELLSKVYVPNNKLSAKEWSLPKSEATVQNQSDMKRAEIFAYSVASACTVKKFVVIFTLQLLPSRDIVEDLSQN